MVTENILIFAGEKKQLKFVLFKACSALNLRRRVRNMYFSTCLCYDSKGVLAAGVQQMLCVWAHINPQGKFSLALGWVYVYTQVQSCLCSMANKAQLPKQSLCPSPGLLSWTAVCYRWWMTKRCQSLSKNPLVLAAHLAFQPSLTAFMLSKTPKLLLAFKRSIHVCRINVKALG